MPVRPALGKDANGGWGVCVRGGRGRSMEAHHPTVLERQMHLPSKLAMAFHGAVELPPEGYPFGQVKPSRKKTEVGSDRASPWSSSGPCDRGWNRTRPLGHHGAPRSSPNGSARTRGGESNERTFATPSPEPCWFKGVRRIRKFGTWALVWFTYVFGVWWVFRTTPSQASTYAVSSAHRCTMHTVYAQEVYSFAADARTHRCTMHTYAISYVCSGICAHSLASIAYVSFKSQTIASAIRTFATTTESINAAINTFSMFFFLF